MDRVEMGIVLQQRGRPGPEDEHFDPGRWVPGPQLSQQRGRDQRIADSGQGDDQDAVHGRHRAQRDRSSWNSTLN